MVSFNNLIKNYLNINQFKIKIIALFLFGKFISYSQTFTTSASGTSTWNTASNWVVTDVCSSPGGYSAPPPTSAAWWPNCPVNIVINRNMTLSGSFVTSGYVNSLTISNGATLTITGNLNFQQNTINTSFITVNSNSNLVVNGTITIEKSITLAGNITTGILTINSGNSLNATTLNATTVNVSGILQISNLLDVSETTTTNSNAAILTMLNGSKLETSTLNVSSGVANINANAFAEIGTLNTGNQASVYFNNYGVTEVLGNIFYQGRINNYGDLSTNNLTGGGSGTSVFNNYSNLELTGNASLPSSSKLLINPGAITIVDGNVTVNANNNLTIGTAVSPPNYADLVIKGNLISTGSGDITVNKNGRFAIWGDFNANDNSGGTFLTLEEGGQMFVNGDIVFSGGGNHIDNKNTQNGFVGLYLDSDSNISFSPNSGSGFIGGLPEGKELDEQNGTNSGYTKLESMPTENNPFLQWLHLQPDSPIILNPLPVELLDFTNTCLEDNTVKIDWSTASENNSSHFEVRKSIDGFSWNTIETVPAAGNSTELIEYSILDRSMTTRNAYYRLNQVDIDGKSELFDVVTSNCVENELNNLLTTYPNPSSNEFYVEFNSEDIEGEATIEISDSRGVIVYRRKVQLEKGTNFFTIGDIKTQEGIYYINLQRDNFKSNVVKQVIR